MIGRLCRAVRGRFVYKGAHGRWTRQGSSGGGRGGGSLGAPATQIPRRSWTLPAFAVRCMTLRTGAGSCVRADSPVPMARTRRCSSICYAPMRASGCATRTNARSGSAARRKSPTRRRSRARCTMCSSRWRTAGEDRGSDTACPRCSHFCALAGLLGVSDPAAAERFAKHFTQEEARRSGRCPTCTGRRRQTHSWRESPYRPPAPTSRPSPFLGHPPRPTSGQPLLP